GVQDDLRFGHGCEDVAVQTFVPQLAIEAFDEGVLHGLARSNEVEADVVRVRHVSIARLTNSPPLSTVIASGARRCRSTWLSAAATLTPVSDRSATSANDSRV